LRHREGRLHAAPDSGNNDIVAPHSGSISFFYVVFTVELFTNFPGVELKTT
jgi:hypothetical protein